MTSLKFYNLYSIKTKTLPLKLKIDKNSKGYFLHFFGGDNNVLFLLYGINKIEFTEEVLGYYKGGLWPYCETKEDCEKLLYRLLEKIETEKDPFISCDFIFKNSDCWDD